MPTDRGGWGGAVVVLRGRESRPPGEGRQRVGRGADCKGRRHTGEYRCRGLAGRGFGLVDGTADAAQIASLGERGLGSPVRNGVVFTGASSVTVTRYRYRVANIPTPWTPTANSG